MKASALVVLSALVVSSVESKIRTNTQQQRNSLSPTTEQIQHTLWYESHGRDDGREWAAGIIKGAQFLKVDFNFRTSPQDCLIQQRLPQGNGTEGYKDGCFILTHYYTQKQPNFNTTQDLIAFIGDRSNDYLFDGSFGKIKFQMCFKHKPGLANSMHQTPGSDAWKWKKLMDAFFAEANQMLESTPYRKENVQFIFNTIPVPSESIPLQSWWPWNTTVNAGLTGISIDHMNDPGYRQAQVMNMEYSSSGWAELHSRNWSKFAVEHSYPFISWEPSDEETITKYYQQMLSYNFYNPAGLLIAFNPDPSLYHTYTSELSGRFSHQDTKPSYIGNIEKTISTKLSLGQGVGISGDYVATIVTNSTSAVSEVFLYGRGLNSNLIPFGFQESKCLTTVSGTSSGGVTAIDGSLEKSSEGIKLQLSLAFADSSVTETVCHPALGGMNGRYKSSLIRHHLSGSEAAKTTPLWSTRARLSQLKNVSIRATYSEISHSIVVDAMVGNLFVGNVTTVETVHKDFVAAWPLPLAIAAETYSYDSATGVAKVVAVVSYSTTTRKVFASYLDLTFETDTNTLSLTSMYPEANSSNPAMLGLGKYPSISLVAGSSFANSTILLTYGDSFCQNSEVIDDDFGLLEGTKECDVNNVTWFADWAQWFQPVQAYNFGEVHWFIHYAQKAIAQRPFEAVLGFANTCNIGMFHGIWDWGHGSSAVLFKKNNALIGDYNVQEGGYVAVTSLKGIEDPILDPILGSFMCGSPRVTNGALMMDSFPLFGIYNLSNV